MLEGKYYAQKILLLKEKHLHFILSEILTNPPAIFV